MCVCRNSNVEKVSAKNSCCCFQIISDKNRDIQGTLIHKLNPTNKNSSYDVIRAREKPIKKIQITTTTTAN